MSKLPTMNILWFGNITDEQRKGIAEAVNRGKPDDHEPIEVNIFEQPAIVIPEGASREEAYIAMSLEVMMTDLRDERPTHAFGLEMAPTLTLAIVEVYKGKIDLPSMPLAYLFENPIVHGQFTTLFGETLLERVKEAKANKAENAA